MELWNKQRCIAIFVGTITEHTVEQSMEQNRRENMDLKKYTTNGKTFDQPESFYSLSDQEQETLLAWCRQFKAITRINTRHTSYGLKHWFEHSPSGFSVSNGAFKGAMLLCGFICSDINDKNWQFNISEASFKQITKEIKKG